MNYKPVITGNQSNGNAGTISCDDVVQRVLLILNSNLHEMIKRRLLKNHEKKVAIQVKIVKVMIKRRRIIIELPDDPNMLELEDIVYLDDDEDVGAEADMNNLDAFMPISPILTTKVHKDHPVEQIIRDLNSTPQTRRMTKNLEEHGYTQEEGIGYDEVFAPVVRIEAIRLFLAYASFKDFVYQKG
ncbi:putative ribonuclease H-like domain-containing protein [Tanacetum coccineum]